MSQTFKIKLIEPNVVQREMFRITQLLKPQVSLFDVSRQVGKTYGFSIEAFVFAMNNKASKVLWISPTWENNARIFKDIFDLFDGKEEILNSIVKQVKFKEQEFVFHNGSVLAFRSAEQGDTLRGRKAHRIYVDEAAFVPEIVVTDILFPMLLRTQGQLILLSTPNGRNWFYKWFMQGQKDHREYNPKELISYRNNYLALNDPAINAFAEKMKKRVSLNKFRREMLAEFITDETLFNNIDESLVDEFVEIKETDELFVGVDIGVSNDFTVVVVLNQNYEMVYLDRFNMRENDLNHKQFKDRIMEFYIEHNEQVTAMYIEQNNMELLIDELYEEYENTYKMFPVFTEGKSKNELIENLSFLFDKNKLKLKNNVELVGELYAYQVKRTISGHKQFHNVGVDHDDIVMGLAIAAFCVKEELGTGIIETK